MSDLLTDEEMREIRRCSITDYEVADVTSFLQSYLRSLLAHYDATVAKHADIIAATLIPYQKTEKKQEGAARLDWRNDPRTIGALNYLLEIGVNSEDYAAYDCEQSGETG